jgi:hypothetical protein
MPEVELVGPEKIPAMPPVSEMPQLKSLIAFDQVSSDSSLHNSAAMFFRNDDKLERVWRNPKAQIAKLGRAKAVIAPDFSVYIDMPRHQRIASVSQSRAVGSLFAVHGLTAIPSIRWATPDDYDFCFLGVSNASVVAISTLGAIRTQEEKFYFRDGLKTMIQVLEPSHVIVHGRMPHRIFEPLQGRTIFHHFPARIDVVHGKNGQDGRR